MPMVRAELTIGHPAEEIICYADENKFDLIVMATHGRSGIGRWALGSVAEKVLRASKVPVLLARKIYRQLDISIPKIRA